MRHSTKKSKVLLPLLHEFKSYELFLMVLEFFLPNLDRSLIITWATKASKPATVDTSILFDSDPESAESSNSDRDDSGDYTLESSFSDENRKSSLSVENEFLLV